MNNNWTFKQRFESSKQYKYLAVCFASTTLILGATVYAQTIRYNNLVTTSNGHINRLATMYGKAESLRAELERNPLVKYEIPKNVTDQIKMVFGGDAELMTKIAVCESGLNPNAKNKGSSARGLLQIMSSVHGVRESWLYNPMINLLIGKSLFDASGVNPWVSSRDCWNK